MITLIYGPNTYVAHQAIEELIAGSSATIERRDGEDISVDALRELLFGASLFASEQLIIIKNAAKNKALWGALGGWLELPEGTQLVLVEEGVDKRTKTFKALQKGATVVVADVLDEARVGQWLITEAKQRGISLQPKEARFLVERVGTDQWLLHHALEKLLLAGDASSATIVQLVEATPQANAFALLDAAFQGKVSELKRLLVDCAAQEDPYKFFGLLANQVFQLCVVMAADSRTAEQIAKDIGAHPYPLKKLQVIGRKLSDAEVKRVVETVAALDDQLKSSAGEPWLLIENALMRIARK